MTLTAALDPKPYKEAKDRESIQADHHFWRCPVSAQEWLPTRADLDAATARTAASIADPSATRADVERAAELEEAVFLAYLQRPGAEAELEAAARSYVTEIGYPPAGGGALHSLHLPMREPEPEPEAGI
jgi:hypothetical protein